MHSLTSNILRSQSTVLTSLLLPPPTTRNLPLIKSSSLGNVSSSQKAQPALRQEMSNPVSSVSWGFSYWLCPLYSQCHCPSPWPTPLSEPSRLPHWPLRLQLPRYMAYPHWLPTMALITEANFLFLCPKTSSCRVNIKLSVTMFCHFSKFITFHTYHVILAFVWVGSSLFLPSRLSQTCLSLIGNWSAVQMSSSYSPLLCIWEDDWDNCYRKKKT